MWPFKKKIKPDYKELVKEDKTLLSKKDVENSHKDFMKETGVLTKLLRRFKKL